MKTLSSQGDEAYSPLFNCGLCIVNFLPKSTVCKGWKNGNFTVAKPSKYFSPVIKFNGAYMGTVSTTTATLT